MMEERLHPYKITSSNLKGNAVHAAINSDIIEARFAGIFWGRYSENFTIEQICKSCNKRLLGLAD